MWEYDILGLISIGMFSYIILFFISYLVTLSIIGGITAIALLLLSILIFSVQKHRSNKRKRLDNNLLRQADQNNDSV